MILSFPYLILISFCRFNSPSKLLLFFQFNFINCFLFFIMCFLNTSHSIWAMGLSPHITWGDGVITSYHMRWRGYHLISHEVTGLSPHITWGDGVRWRGYHLISHEVTGLSPHMTWGGVITSYHMRWWGYLLRWYEVITSSRPRLKHTIDHYTHSGDASTHSYFP